MTLLALDHRGNGPPTEMLIAGDAMSGAPAIRLRSVLDQLLPLRSCCEASGSGNDPE